jgi:hypothetical protein
MGRPPLLEPYLLAHVTAKKDQDMTKESSELPRDRRGRHNVIDKADRQHSNILADRDVSAGPLTVERMKKEIETLKETLRESRQVCRRQARVIELVIKYTKSNTLYAATRGK